MTKSFVFASSRTLIALALAVMLALSIASAANAQTATNQYGTPTSPSGPLASLAVIVNDANGNGLFDAGDTGTIPGNFIVSPGASVTLQDSDGTQGTFLDGANASITQGSVIIKVTGSPMNVTGGNKVLNTAGLFVVSSTGIAKGSSSGASSGGAASGGAASGGAASGGAVGGASASQGSAAKSGAVLPKTGGPLLLIGLGSVALIGTGLIGLRRFGR